MKGHDARHGTEAMRERMTMKRLLTITALAVGMLAALPAIASAQFGIQSFTTDAANPQAGAHSDVSTAFTLNTDELGNPIDQLKDVTADLPPGLVGNPQNIPTCSHRDFENFNCNANSEVGVLEASFVVCKGKSTPLTVDATAGDTEIFVDNTDGFCADDENNTITIGSGPTAETAHIAFFPSIEGRLQLAEPLANNHTVGEDVTHTAVPLAAPIPLFNLDPMPGHTATLAASLLIATIIVNVDVRPDGGLTATISDTSTFLSVASTKLTLWGVPSDPSHDALRCGQIGQDCGQTGRVLTPFMTNPTDCSGGPVTTTLRITSWQDPGTVVEQTASQDAPTGCDKLVFDPSVSFTPTVNAADSPSGFAFNLHVPQDDEPYSLATPALRTAAVTLPEGVSVNPSSADGLGACTQDQFGLGNNNAVTCSNASKIGSAEIVTPLLADPLEGSIYLATPNDNPFGSLLAVYVVAEGSNVLIKLAGRIDADPDTGQLTTTFQDNPQVPFSDLSLTFFAGQRGALATPKTCGIFQTTAELTPWSAPDSGAPATPSSSFDITSGPNGSACSASLEERPFDPGFVAGMVSPTAGAFTPLTLKVSRDDGDQDLSTIDATLPPGVSAKLAGVPLCTGTAAANGTCTAASQVGTVDIAAGAGSNPFHLAGTVYLTGPYNGAPLGLSIVTQAVAGPLDLGKVVVRAAIFVDPRDAHLSVVSDPLPTILAGIPLRLRSVRVLMNRANFTVNPTNCSEMAVTGEIGASDGATADVSNRFQVGECRSLGFQPTLIPRAIGGKPATKPGKNPGLDVELSARPGDANIKTAAVTLPNTLTLDSTHLGLFCSQQQLETNACPPESQFGSANATSPLLDGPLSGPVFLVTSPTSVLPDVVADLDGQVHLEVHGATVITNSGRLKNTFASPDVPIGTFTLSFDGGSHGLLVNTTNLCSKKAKKKAFKVKITGQNGAVATSKPKLRKQCS